MHAESEALTSKLIASVKSSNHLDRELRRDRGATLVEAAVVLPLLFVVLFALVEFGLAFKDNLSVGHGAREAARAGATFGNDPYTNFLILQEIQEVMDPVGIADDVRVRIYNPITNAGDMYRFQDGYAFGCDWNPCPDPDAGAFYSVPSWNPSNRDVSAPFTDRLGVRVTFRHQWITKLFRDTSDFTKDVDFQIEPQVFDP